MAISIGEIIQHYRNDKKMSQEKLAEGICSREYIGAIEKGKNIPTLELVTRLSERLNVDLYSVYSNVYRHHDLQTHLEMQKLSKAIGHRNIGEVTRLVNQLEGLEGFLKGEPRQVICYAKSIIYGETGNVKEESVLWCEKGLQEKYPLFPRVEEIPEHISNVDFALILSYAVMLCRNQKIEQGLYYLNFIQCRAHHLLKNSIYDKEYNKSFWLNVECSCIYNKYIFCDEISIAFLEEIESILSYQKTNNRSHMLPELMLCKAAVLMNLNKTLEAKQIYKSACALGQFFFTEQQYEILERSIINTHSNLNLFHDCVIANDKP